MIVIARVHFKNRVVTFKVNFKRFITNDDLENLDICIMRHFRNMPDYIGQRSFNYV